MNESARSPEATETGLDRDALRRAIRDEYRAVADHPDRGFHFHTGRDLCAILGYDDDLLEGVPEDAVAAFAGTGNPFRLGPLDPGERVVDVGCGAGIDSFVAAREVGADGRVIGVDMTPEMLARAERAKTTAGTAHVEFRHGHAEDLPVDDEWADVVLSNGMLNLTPDKIATLREWHRVLKPGGRLQVADILVSRAVPEGAKRKIDLWTG